MIRLPILKDELAFLEKHMPELEGRPELISLVADFKKQIAEIRQQIQNIEKQK